MLQVFPKYTLDITKNVISLVTIFHLKSWNHY